LLDSAFPIYEEERRMRKVMKVSIFFVGIVGFVVTLSGHASASYELAFDMSTWQTQLANAGLQSTLEDFNRFPDGDLPSFSVAGVNFNDPWLTGGYVSGGQLWGGDFRCGPVWVGTITGEPLYGFAFSSIGWDVMGVDIYDVNGYVGNIGHQGEFFGVVNSAPLTSVRFYISRQLENPDGIMDDLYVATAVPIPAAVWLLGSGLIGLVGIRRRFNK
jgi:hypothetical protein